MGYSVGRWEGDTLVVDRAAVHENNAVREVFIELVMMEGVWMIQK
jgi:hypothetical protein